MKCRSILIATLALGGVLATSGAHAQYGTRLCWVPGLVRPVPCSYAQQQWLIQRLNADTMRRIQAQQQQQQAFGRIIRGY